ncbi:hypothetical protein H8356DRAFT_1725091 [Neocallimastix lanati (nom. inval.)]|uniref:Uncharacterized protein n=1 Tax=Neocallimastix californiae TaxID=1754190 RepID=A0A1Y2CCN8_9FUNG|nr:hypothetical protein H8356DRAFT_1725091 [Neocallimastix sp. JGI-2020a]ORY44594.1 hypothetical protein LY90DRAFT_21381 [Neocallimastix californiae]|eukprot:ORY44594.1 hypothetical protein LY90DRAFT_21381 [Neocallimastix californiae]
MTLILLLLTLKAKRTKRYMLLGFILILPVVFSPESLLYKYIISECLNSFLVLYFFSREV